MFELFIKKENEEDFYKTMDIVEKIAGTIGYVSLEDLECILPWGHYDKNFEIEDCKNLGWTYKQLIEEGYTITYITSDPEFKVKLPDPATVPPVDKNTEKSSDMVKSPDHYEEGRKYAPRKVIADWELNFNLGNAVKYISRAGRKGDKIEDLRKAIQYIEFEIEECSNSSEYDELLEIFKSKSIDEQNEIIKELKSKLNYK